MAPSAPADHNRDRNPDALSSRIDQATNTLMAIQSKLQGMLISVRGEQPSPLKDSANAPLKDPDMITRMQMLQSLTNGIEAQCDELRGQL